MASIRDYMANPWWASTYNRYNFTDPSNVNYGHFAYAARHKPIVVDSNPEYSVAMDRHGQGAGTYNIGAVGVYARHNNLGMLIGVCSDLTGAPNLCAKKYLGDRADFLGNPQYDRLG
jgi:hypothetical protein